MSFKIVEQAPARLNRSELAVPGSSPRFFEKAEQADVDVVFLDLEDAVAPDEKNRRAKTLFNRSMTWRGRARPCRCASMAWTPITCIAMWWMSLNRRGSVWISS